MLWHGRFMHTTEPQSPSARPALSGREFVAMMAMLMALNALAIDSMLPALPDIARSLGAPSANAQQLVITLYFLGLGVGSLVHGPLADRFGRRRVILASVFGYIVAALFSALAPDWNSLLVARFTHGLFGAAMGVVTTAIIRDRTSGDRMAQMLSMVFLVFMIVPILAPSIGQAIMSVANWHWIFAFLTTLAMVMAAWVWFRLPETLVAEDVLPLRVGPMLSAWKTASTNRQAMAYMLGSAIVVGANFGFLNSSQQIIDKTFGRADIFGLAFACVAIGMATANFFNSRLVLRFGARRVSQTALILFIVMSGLQWALALTGETLALFLFVLTLNMSMIGFIGANFSSIAMQPFGHIAGTASSYQNAVRTIVSAVIGGIIGQSFDGTTLPLAQGYVVCGIVAMLLVLWGEKGKLFTRPNAPHPAKKKT